LKKFLFWLLWLPFGLAFVALAVANRTLVSIRLDPTGAELLPTLEAPLFMVIFFFLILGTLLGGVMVWLRQGIWRNRARQAERENKAVLRDMQRVKLERAALSAPSEPLM
jgi:Lipopolysaccharide assembly protein A domain